MSLVQKIQKGSWAKVCFDCPQGAQNIDWDLVGGKTYFVVDVNLDIDMVFLRTYEDTGINHWFFAEWLTLEPYGNHTNEILKEEKRISEFQKRLRDQYLKEVFSAT